MSAMLELGFNDTVYDDHIMLNGDCPDCGNDCNSDNCECGESDCVY